MTSIRIRPRFKVESPFSEEEIHQRLRRALSAPGAPCMGKIITGHIVLMIPPEEQHYWSPQLSLSIEPLEGGGSLIRGLYGPKPSIWAMFTLGYAAIGILMFFLGIIGFSSLSLGKEAGILWILPLLALAAAILYLIAQFGQKVGVEQTFTLHHFYEDTLGTKVHIQ